MTNARMIIGGERRAAPRTFDVINPATGAVHGRAPECTRDQLDEALAAAEHAFADWRTDDKARCDALLRCADAILAATDELAPLLTAEQGRPIAQARYEVGRASAWFRYFAELDLEPETIQDDHIAHVELRRRPMGVVAAITPWNYPLLLAGWKLAPALRAGNTAVIKPSPYTPLSTLRMLDVLDRVLPPGVVNAVTGGDELGAWITRHPTPRKVSFTGSVATGRRVATATSPDLKRITLELGGNDAAVVLDDADPAVIADRLFGAAFANTGQACAAIKRVYVAASLHDDLVEALVERATAVRVGDGMDPDTQLGPISTQPQFARVRALVAAAFDDGGRAVTGGAPLDRPGYFFAPTIMTGLRDESSLVAEEQFGPVLPVLAYRDAEEAVARANATSFGLGGSVWSSDADRAERVADGLDCGTVWINSHLALAPHQPFGGVKHSGVGVENGPWGLASFSDLQVRYRPREGTSP